MLKQIIDLKIKSISLPYISATFLAAVLILFNTPVNKLLNAIFVDPLFASFEPRPLADVTLLLILTLIIVWIAKEFSWRFILKPGLSILIFYGFQRINEYWTFFQMALVPQIAYWDILAVCCFVSLPLSLLLQRNKQGLKESVPGLGFVEDNEVSSYDGDHFGRKVTADEIARLIISTNNRKSFAIGILGEYGSGKSSFLNLINLGLDEKQVLKIDFNPWHAVSPEMIRREFFDLLAAKVASLDSKISSLIYSYGRKLASFDQRPMSLLNWFDFLRNPLVAKRSGEYQKINDMLSATGLKIVISIDDVDRLYPSEILELLKIIRNTADFSNVVYLVAYDKEYVQESVRVLNETRTQDYLDKIFQLEIPLPKREEADLITALRTQLKNVISAAHFEIFQNTLIPTGLLNRYGQAYGHILRQGRDVVRFVNSFKIIYNLIGEEVDFENFFVLELIKFRFPTIYDLIYTQSDQFLYETPVHYSYAQYFSPQLVKDGNPNTEVPVFTKYIQKLGTLSDRDVTLLETLFMTLFKGSKYQVPEPKNSISYPLYFDIYFRYRLSQVDLSDKDFKNALTPEKIGKFMTYCSDHNLHKELMIRLMQEDISVDRRHFELVVRAIFLYGRTFVEKESVGLFDYGNLIDKIYNYQNGITESLYKKEPDGYKLFIKSLLDSAMAPYLFENELIYHIKLKGSGFVLSLAELSSYQLFFFSDFSESGHGLSSQVVHIFWGARQYPIASTELSTSDNGELWQFDPELVKKMKTYLVTKDPKEFLKSSIQRDMRDNSVICISQHVLNMFKDPAEYRKVIEENPILVDEIKLEYLELFDKCALVNFHQFVEMELKSELKNVK